jgi:predicted nuclease of restriction endonuclease-like (RecB) superfamily
MPPKRWLNSIGAALATPLKPPALPEDIYWEIGRRIVTLEQGGEHRAEYGEQVVGQLVRDLTRQFGRGFWETNLKQMRTFYRAWPDSQIRQTLSDESATPNSINALGANYSTISVLATRFALPWSGYVRLLSVKNQEARNFYETEALRSGWSVRQLNRQIGSQFYERIALSRNKAAMLQKAETAEPGDTMTPEEAIKDPFVLEFLELKDEYSESDSSWKFAMTSGVNAAIEYFPRYFLGVSARRISASWVDSSLVGVTSRRCRPTASATIVRSAVACRI